MIELIIEAVARQLEFSYAPGNFECEEYNVVYKDGMYQLVDLVSPVTGSFRTDRKSVV